jgi:ABC-type sugar transport system substrate-binding protein
MLLETFTLFRHPTSATEATDLMTKVVARYPQVEGAVAIHDEVLAGGYGSARPIRGFTETGRVSRARGLG